MRGRELRPTIPRSTYSAWYKTRRWQQLRQMQLAVEPLCRFCKARGITTAATVCDHITPHRGDVELFWSGPFQSLCENCHNVDKARQERGLEPKPWIGRDGWPVG
jgi:5-methylcytosine-specific restriction protein A